MSFNKIKLLLVLSLLTTFSSCGYKSSVAKSEEPIAVSIPLITNDESGLLRNELARTIASSGRYRYSSTSGSRYQLVIKIKGDRSESIGYTWDQKPSGELLNRLYPNEGRRVVTVAVSIKDTDTGKDLVAPFSLTSHADFDFVNPTSLQNIEFTNMYGQSESSLQFSLGQLDSEEGAKNESFAPLFKELAGKIVSALAKVTPKV